MKIILAQMRVVCGDMRRNMENLEALAKKAAKLGADLAAFPEMCLSGYLLGDEWTQDSFIEELLSYNDRLKKLSKDLGIIIVYGNVDSCDEKNEDGRIKKFNAVYLAQNGKLQVRRKSLLPNYRIFDDKRYFSSGLSSDPSLSTCYPVKLSDSTKIGLEVCEDLWCADYAVNPTVELIKNGAQFIINVSASPFSVGKPRARDNRIKELKALTGNNFVPFYYVNCVGTQNNGKTIAAFDGDSRIYDKNGANAGNTLEFYEEGFVETQKKQKTGVTPMPPSIELKFLAIMEAYRSLDEAFGNPKYVFGLSGGIDSALNMVLCSLALGKEKILAYNLPTVYNSQNTKNAAQKLCDSLKIPLNFIEIDSIFKEFEKALKKSSDIQSITEENLQARIRTVILMAQTSQENAVLINNTNKVELALGYGTLYGDLAGAWCPLGDLTKVEIWEMARYINSKFADIIPKELIPDKNFHFGKNRIRPSAELRENQFDPMIWGFDDKILELFMEYKKRSPEKILAMYKNAELKDLCKKYGLEDAAKFIEHIEWFFAKLYANVFKRIQAPPVLMLSKSAFGADYRESQYRRMQTKEYKKLKREILA
jgi:NAD+ synthase (glutamine-hydrolysing)